MGKAGLYSFMIEGVIDDIDGRTAQYYEGNMKIWDM